jgi:hypothetical protein
MSTYGYGLRLMQGGVDRTGYGKMIDELGTPGLDLIKQRRAAAAQSAALDEFEKKLQGLYGNEGEGEGEGDDNQTQFSFGNALMGALDDVQQTGKLAGSKVSQGFDDVIDSMKYFPSTAIGSQLADFMMPYYEKEFDDLVEEGADPMGTALFLSKSGTIPGLDLEMGMADGGRIHLQGGGMDAGKDSKSGDMGMGAGVSRDVQRSMNGGGGGGGGSNINNQSTAETVTETTEQPSMAFVKPAVTVRPEDLITIDQPMMKYSPPEETSVLDALSNLNFFEGTYGDPDDGLSFSYDIDPLGGDASAQLGYSFADGGRVEMQLGGGLMNNLLGQPGVQQALQNQIYQQPTIGFQPLPDPTIGDLAPLPDPRMGMGMPPPPATAQAYNPFVSNMPLYDPSTLGTGLPSTAGMVDPYFVYDRYSPAGAFDAPPANIGGFLSRKEIEKGFSDLDKFTLTKQEEKKKAAQAAAKAVKKPKDTEGKDGSKSD